MKESYLKNVCCRGDLNIAVRFIAFIGLLTSLLLLTALINDKVANHYDVSRIIAAGLGLDWRHFHSSANVSPQADPEGKKIFILMLVYTVIFFTTNVLLMVAAIFEKRYLVFPWLLCEFVDCVSKIGALIYHLVVQTEDISDTFIYGSVSYFVIMSWWWLAVYGAQSSWKPRSKERFQLSLISIVGRESSVENEQSSQHLRSTFIHNKSQFDSPRLYLPNECYSSI